MSEIYTDFHFPVCIHRIENKEFLPLVTPVFDNYVKMTREKFPLNSLYPATMTDIMFREASLTPFFDFILSNAVKALNVQGYDTEKYVLGLESVFGQQHEYMSSMESHFHNTVLSGFYFLDVPSGIKALFHDPKDVKVYSSLEENLKNNFASAATNIINYDPYPGLLMLTPSWLKHSFTRNPSRTPFKFLHISVVANFNHNRNSAPAPIIV
jgi:hypothetical protein